MKPLMWKVLFFILVYSSGQWVSGYQLCAQPTSLRDSLQQILLQFADSSKDEKLKKAIQDVQTLYTKHFEDTLLAEKLLIVDSVLVNSVHLNEPTIYSLVEMIARLLQPLRPANESEYYTISLDYQAYLNYATGWYEKALPLYQQSLAIRKKTIGD